MGLYLFKQRWARLRRHNHTDINFNILALHGQNVLSDKPSISQNAIGNKSTHAHLLWKSRRVSRSKTRQSIRHHHHSFTISPYRVTVGLGWALHISKLYFWPRNHVGFFNVLFCCSSGTNDKNWSRTFKTSFNIVCLLKPGCFRWLSSVVSTVLSSVLCNTVDWMVL